MATSLFDAFDQADTSQREVTGHANAQLARRAQQDMDMHSGNRATKWREEHAKSYADWELLPAAKQQNSAEG